MNTKECHRRSRHTRHRGREADVGDHQGKVAAPSTLPEPISGAGGNAAELCLREDAPRCQLEHVTSCQQELHSQLPGSYSRGKSWESSLGDLATLI